VNNYEKKLLEEELNLLKKSNEILVYSYNMCKKIGIKDEYTFEELDRFEALTSRFARTSDIIIQKIFRLIDILELEPSGSIIDRINRAEGRGIIDSANTFKEIRRLRNDIAHEYISLEIKSMFKNVLRLTPELIYCSKNLETYGKNLLDNL
jgi:uncharacterized protein YutE (UPF0331/DUF86 family)